MIPDWETNTVFLSNLLPARYRDACEGLLVVLRDHGVEVKFLETTRDVWIRDYAPIQVSHRRFVKFRYSPDYLEGYASLMTGDAICEGLSHLGSIRKSNLVVDGGNVVAAKSKVVSTDKIYRENRDRRRTEVKNDFLQALSKPDWIIIPVEPMDPIGHSDGLVRFVDEGRVVVNDFSRIDSAFGRRLERALVRHGLEIHRLPYCPNCKHRGQIPSATGNYVNYLRVGNLVVLPAYGYPEDEMAVRVLREMLPKATVVPVPCSEIAQNGGCWNCVSWTVKI
jgi:agmatine deiminase